MGNRCPKCNTDNPSGSKFCKECAASLTGEGAVQASFTKTLETPSKGIVPGATFAARYKIIEELGRGGMGVVYKAEDAKLKRTVAIKLLPPELTGDKEARERFIREAQSAAVLDHPNICTIFEVDESQDKTFISMAYVDGQNLRDRVKDGPLEMNTALDLAIQAAEGLVAAHNKGIIHRDIKSANIMVTKQGQAKIMDFGLAKFAGASMITREGVTMGTVAYMSPEQAQGKVVDHRSDIWSLGVVLYEMFGGQLPFQGETEASFLYSIVHEDPAPLKTINPEIPPEILKVIDRALKKKPEDRFQSASELGAELKRYREQVTAEEAGLFSLRSLLQRLRQPRYAISILLAGILLIVAAVGYFNRQSKIQWAKEVAIPAIENKLAITNVTSMDSAYKIAVDAEKYIPNDSRLEKIFSMCATSLKVNTIPSGATIYYKSYIEPNSEWKLIGESPISGLRFPMGFFRWKIEKSGYEPMEVAFMNFSPGPEGWVPLPLNWSLDRLGIVPKDMARQPSSQSSIGKLPSFYMDKYEVTNKQFKEFIDFDGYRKKEYWKQPFIKEGLELTWADAMADFVDTSGRPGPSTWQAGDYPDGEDDFPVSGVSWYEAAAYAEWAGKELPTSYHWDAVFTNLVMPNQFFLPSIFGSISNFGDGPVPVKSTQSLSFFGCYDLAGNVREWCWNDTSQGKSLRGGAWDQATYMMANPSNAPAFDRSDTNGFRCVIYPEKDKIPAEAFQEETQYKFSRDYYNEPQVSDEEYQKYFRDQFIYEKNDLDANVEYTDENPEDWLLEKVSFNAAYNNERMAALLFLPKQFSKPYQTIIFFPGSAAVLTRSSKNLWYEEDLFDFMIKSGRAVIYPIYKGTYERGDGSAYSLHLPVNNRQHVDYMIQVIKDFERSIDYLETRNDIDVQKLAFYGYSWGGLYASINTAIEDRLVVSILNLAGLALPLAGKKAHPLMDPFHYVSRVKVPTLILSGEFDVCFPYDLVVKPMYDLLGTPAENKRSVIFPTDHNIPKNDLIRESLRWLDKYLGPVSIK